MRRLGSTGWRSRRPPWSRRGPWTAAGGGRSGRSAPAPAPRPPRPATDPVVWRPRPSACGRGTGAVPRRPLPRRPASGPSARGRPQR
ncbi:hypothetical protein ACFFX0_24265 [Citricoccus parietis]|uniref:Uncharacterized protein n=1 Tax=Citricoccus parietis TaxID=592307 RepID=A0ABV5G5H0_9MICC